MKTKFVTIVAALAAMASTAQTNQVLSRNAVGYVRLDIPPAGQFTLVASPFVPLEPVAGPGTLTLQDVLPKESGIKFSQNPNQVDKVYLWDVGNQVYQTVGMKTNGQYYLLAGYASNPATNPAVLLGEGFWIQSPSAVSTVHTVYVMGEVPSASNVTNPISPAYQFRANPYPVTASLDSLINTNHGALGTGNPNTCDQILMWTTNQTYLNLGLKTPTNRWWPLSTWTVTSYPVVTVEPGQAFWYRSKRVSAYNWTSAKPYTWP